MHHQLLITLILLAATHLARAQCNPKEYTHIFNEANVLQKKGEFIEAKNLYEAAKIYACNQKEMEIADRKIDALFEQIIDHQSANQQIIMAYAPSYDVLRGNFEVSEENKYDSLLTLAYKSMDESRFLDAVQLFKNILPNDPRQRVVTYELPYALFYAKKFGEASIAFENLKKIDKFDADRIQWFQLLCYIAEGRDGAAQKALDDIIAKPSHLYKEDAIRLKYRLDEK